MDPVSVPIGAIDGAAPSGLGPRTGAGGPAGDWGTWLLAGNGLLLLLFLLWMPFHWGGDAWVAPINDLINLTLGLSLTALAWRAAGSAALPRCARLGWRLVALGCLAYWIGNLLWFGYEVLLEVEPFPSLADLGYLAFIPLMLAGILCLIGPRQSLAERARLWIDAGTVAIGVGAAIWYFLLEPIAQAPHGGPLELFLAEAYPVGDMVLLFGVVALILERRRDRPGLPFAWLALGLLFHFAADLRFAYQALQGAYGSGGIADALYNIAYFLMMLGPYLEHRLAGRPLPQAVWIGHPLLRPSLLPFGAVALAFGLLLYVSRDHWGSPVGGLIVAAALLAALVAARLVLSGQENARLLAERAARESEARFASMVRHSSDAILLLGRDLKIRYASLAAERVLGIDAQALTGRPLLDLVHGDDRPRAAHFLRGCLKGEGTSPIAEWRLGSGPGATRHLESVATNLLDDPGVGGLVLNSRDVTDRKLLEERLQEVAFRDPLTELANRTLLRVRIEHALVRAGRAPEQVAVLLLDLDNFRTVNEALGHDLGDALLRVQAERLLGCARATDTVARLGGDELAVLLEDPMPLPALAELVERILARLAEPIALGGRELTLTASIGVARGRSGAEADLLLADAEIAMYTAKGRGRGGWALFEPGMHAAAMLRIDLEADLRRALERGEILLHYQPIVRLPGAGLVGVEALVRWQHPRHGLLQPGAFVPLAEESPELICALGRLVLREACRQGAHWQARCPAGARLHLAVNVSAQQLEHSDLAGVAAAALRESGLAPESLVLELTEGALVQGTDAVLRQLFDLRALGVRLAIDDFGTGYSSLSYLHRFPMDILKIDKSFVDPLGEASAQAPLAGAIAAIAQSLGMATVAEGVERADQADALLSLGCTLAQGYHFSRPLPAHLIEARWIDRCALPPDPPAPGAGERSVAREILGS